MRNVWGQEIVVGSLVYRGARQGNSSEYKIGVILTMAEGKAPRVKWLFESSLKWLVVGTESVRYPYAKRVANQGSPAFDSLIRCDMDIEELGRISDILDGFKNGERFVNQEHLEEVLSYK